MFTTGLIVGLFVGVNLGFVISRFLLSRKRMRDMYQDSAAASFVEYARNQTANNDY